MTDHDPVVLRKLTEPTPKIDMLLLTAGTLAALVSVIEAVRKIQAGDGVTANAELDDALSTIGQLKIFLEEMNITGEIARGA